MNSCGLWMGPRRLFVTLRDHHGLERFLSISPSNEARDAFLSYLVTLAPVCLVMQDCSKIRSDPLVPDAGSIADIYLVPSALLEGVLSTTSTKASPRRRAQVLARLPSSPLRPYLNRLVSRPKADTRQISLI